MPLRFAKPGALSSGAMVNPDTQAAASLGEHQATNYHLAGTPLQPAASQQIEPLRRPIDPADPELVRTDVMSGNYLLPGNNVAATSTITADTPQQALVRAETLDTNRQGSQQANELQRVTTFQEKVVPAQIAQRNADQLRAQEGLVNNAVYRDTTAQTAQAEAFLNDQMMSRVGERELAVLDNLARRMGGAPSAMAVSA